MGIEKFIEDQVRKAMDAGEFDNLPGKGKPIDLKAYFETPEDLRLAYSILKSNNFVPEEIELLKEITALKSRLASCSDVDQRSKLSKEIREKTFGFNMLLEKGKRRR
ncbi:MAG TPA: DUF1992 domain-containing protein [Blastocatellia bacterium]|jgi:hypothetical protein